MAKNKKFGQLAAVRKLGTNTPKIRNSGSHGAKNAPAPNIPQQKIAKHGAAPPQQGTKLHPEVHSQQLNPISGNPGMPQYKDERIPGSNLRALIAHLRGS